MIELKVTSLLPTRLDKYLMQEFPALGLGRLNKALRENKIKLNGKKQPLSTRVLNGLALPKPTARCICRRAALPRSCIRTKI